jgi:hypothetical protein
MLTRILLLGALMTGVALVLAGSASADDVHDLKLKTPSSANFTHDSRAQADEDDLENINLRYWLGYWRGSHNIGYIARFYAFRAGHADGSSGAGSSFSGGGQANADSQNYAGAQTYGGGQGRVGAQSYGGGPGYGGQGYGGAPNYGGQGYGASPNYGGGPAPSSGGVGTSQQLPPPTRTPSPGRRPGTLPIPQDFQPMPEVAPPPSRRPGTLPIPQDFQPMPEVAPPLPSEPQPKRSKGTEPGFGGSAVAFMSLETPTKKLHYPAYGEHLRSPSAGDSQYASQKK